MAIAEVKSNKTYTDLYGAHLNNLVVFGNPNVPNKFLACVDMEFWGETKITFCEKGVEGVPTLKDNVLELDLGPKKYQWYQQSDDPSTLKWIITLKEKPVGNTYQFELGGKWKDFGFHRQTPFTELYPPEDIVYSEQDGEEWVEVPSANIRRLVRNEGSYAVIHKVKRNHARGQINYKTGKVLHIGTPKATDAVGKSVWTTLRIENGVYKVTIPQDFLDIAVYPVVVNDILTEQSIGASTYGISADMIVALWVGNMPAAGTLDQISVYDSDGSAVSNCFMGLYSGTAGEPKAPVTRVYTSAELDFGSGAAWHDESAGSEALGNGLEMFPAVSTENNSDWRVNYDTVAGYYFASFQSATHEIPSSPPAWDDEWFDRQVSGYINYTPSVAGNAGIMTPNTGFWGPTF